MYDVTKKDYLTSFQQNLTVIIYSHNNSYKVKELVESLYRQEYDRDKYSVNILLDNCNDENIKLLEILGGAKLWRINTDVKPIGKYKALSWLFERIMAYENTNAFVFLSADHKIKTDFLQKVNTAVHYAPVVVGEVILKKNNFFNRLLNLKNKLRNRVVNNGRFYADLGNIIETDVLVINQEILEKVKFKRTDFGFEEYEYALKLKNNEIPVMYSRDVFVVKTSDETIKTLAVKDYRRRYKSLITLKNNLSILFSDNSIGIKELLLSLLYPSNTLFVVLNFYLMFVQGRLHNIYFSHAFSIKFLTYLLASKFVADIYSMFTIRSGLNDYKNSILLFFVSPVVFVKSLMLGFLGDFHFELPKRRKPKTKAMPLNFQKHTVDATITNGKQELPCIIEIIKTDEYSQVVFRFRDKKLTSTKQPRINYALEEIVTKLKNHGFALKVCLNCGYFYLTESTAAHSYGEKGYCLLNNFKSASKQKEYSCVWERCFSIIPCQARGYILQQLGLEKSKTNI